MSELTGNQGESCPLNHQAVGRVLHALEPDEEMAVLLHLPQCRSCQAAEREAEEVMSSLGRAVEQVDPPPALRESLLRRVAETPQHQQALPLRRPEEVAPRRPVVPAPHKQADQTAPAPPAAPPSGSWFSRRGRVLVAASMVLVAVLSIGGLVARTIQLEQQRDAQIAQTQSVTDLLQRLGRPGTQYALLSSTDTGATVAAVLLADGERQVFPVGLPPNAADRVYVLWGLNTGGAPEPLGTFDVAPSSPNLNRVGPTTAPVDGYTTYAISLESGRAPPDKPSGVLASGVVAT